MTHIGRPGNRGRDSSVVPSVRYGIATFVTDESIHPGRLGAALEERGFRVLLHSRVPCNDGGISLGQAVIAGSASAGLA